VRFACLYLHLLVYAQTLVRGFRAWRCTGWQPHGRNWNAGRTGPSRPTAARHFILRARFRAAAGTATGGGLHRACGSTHKRAARSAARRAALRRCVDMRSTSCHYSPPCLPSCMAALEWRRTRLAAYALLLRHSPHRACALCYRMPFSMHRFCTRAVHRTDVTGFGLPGFLITVCKFWLALRCVTGVADGALQILLVCGTTCGLLTFRVHATTVQPFCGVLRNADAECETLSSMAPAFSSLANITGTPVLTNARTALLRGRTCDGRDASACERVHLR